MRLATFFTGTVVISALLGAGLFALGFVVGFSGVQLERLGDQALTALVAFPCAFAVALVIRAGVRFDRRVRRIIDGLERPKRVQLRVVSVDRDSEPPRSAA